MGRRENSYHAGQSENNSSERHLIAGVNRSAIDAHVCAPCIDIRARLCTRARARARIAYLICPPFDERRMILRQTMTSPWIYMREQRFFSALVTLRRTCCNGL